MWAKVAYVYGFWFVCHWGMLIAFFKLSIRRLSCWKLASRSAEMWSKMVISMCFWFPVVCILKERQFFCSFDGTLKNLEFFCYGEVNYNILSLLLAPCVLELLPCLCFWTSFDLRVCLDGRKWRIPCLDNKMKGNGFGGIW